MRAVRRVLLALAVLAPGVGQAQGLRLGLAAPGPGYVAALQKAVLRPFTASAKASVRVVPVAPARWDIAQLGPAAVQAACAAGSIARIDWDRIGGRGRFLPAAVSDCGAGAYLRATVLAWDGARVSGTPGWGDFWDVVRRPGGRGLHLGPQGTLEIALMADGVAPADVYNVLRGRDGPARAFRKLDQLRPYIVWCKTDAEAMAVIASGRALMSSVPYEQVVAAGALLHRRFGVQWGGSLVSAQSWVFASRGKRLDQAEVLGAMATAPGVQGALLAGSGFGSAVVPVAGQQAPGGLWPDGALDHAVGYDAGFWRDNAAALTVQFNDWLKR